MTLFSFSNKIFIFIIITAGICFAGVCEAGKTGILLANDQGKILYVKNADHKFVPASITKVLTSLAALETLGPDFRFETPVGYDPATTDIYIKGSGDPLFISEQIKHLAHGIITNLKPKTVNDIILDHHFFSPDIVIPGTGRSSNPYDATTGALCANFNTIFFKWDKAQKIFLSAEPQTPLPNLFQNDIRRSGLKKGRILLSKKWQRIYPGLLVKTFLKTEGIDVIGRVKTGSYPAIGLIRFNFKSGFTLKDAVKKLLRFSNNFMANQIMLTMGAIKFGAPATLDKGATCLRAFADNQLKLTNITLEEGSGLSRRNRFTPRQMLKILLAFKPYYHLMRNQGNEYYKTGTLSNIRTRAGYLKGKDKRLYPFVIMVNQAGKGYTNIRKMLIKRVAAISAAT